MQSTILFVSLDGICEIKTYDTKMSKLEYCLNYLKVMFEEGG